MFYEKSPKEQQDLYKKLLRNIGSLSNLFSESDCPYLVYRAHENIFCRSFNAENLARHDCSADAKKEKVGIGLKTWVGSSNQKVAEFNKLKAKYQNLQGIELAKKIAELRNERIRVTKNLYDIQEMIYHVVERKPNKMELYECGFDEIDVENIKLITQKGSLTNIYFTDGHHVYHFNSSKSTLYMLFDDMEMVDCFSVDILENPYILLESIFDSSENGKPQEQGLPEYLGIFKKPEKETLHLRLFSIGTKKQMNGATGIRLEETGKYAYVPRSSGLNQWNAGGRVRHPNEIYIPYPVEAKKDNPNFFPPRDVPFELELPDGKIISAKVCQDNGKAIMSNPNKALGKWLLRDVFDVEYGKIITYEMLQEFGVDSVVFTKLSEKRYSIDFYSESDGSENDGD